MENCLVSEAPRRSKASRLLTFGAGAAAGFVAVGVVYYVSTSQDDTSTVAIADTSTARYRSPSVAIDSSSCCENGQHNTRGYCDGSCSSCNHGYSLQEKRCVYSPHDHVYGPKEEEEEEDADLSLEAEDDADDDVSVFAEDATKMRARRFARKGMKRRAKRSARKGKMAAPKKKATKKKAMRRRKMPMPAMRKKDDEEEEDDDLSLEAEDDADEDVSAFAQEATAMRAMRRMTARKSMKKMSMRKSMRKAMKKDDDEEEDDDDVEDVAEKCRFVVVEEAQFGEWRCR